MNERIKRLSQEAFAHAVVNGQDYKPQTDFDRVYDKKFAELIVRECAQLARDTNLEDVEGGDSAVLRAAKRQILEHFGVKE